MTGQPEGKEDVRALSSKPPPASHKLKGHVLTWLSWLQVVVRVHDACFTSGKPVLQLPAR